MQPAYIVPAAEWDSLTARLARLEAAELARTASTTTEPDEVLSTARAAEYIGLSADALLRARRKGHLQGVRINRTRLGFPPLRARQVPPPATTTPPRQPNQPNPTP